MLMAAGLGRPVRVTGLTDRLGERAALGLLADAVLAGESRALVVRGDPGVGKTMLLDHLAKRVSGAGCRVVRAVGVRACAVGPSCALCPPPFRCQVALRCASAPTAAASGASGGCR